MRKNTIRKIVHGILDLLPLFVIPTFMIYARNENSSFGYQVEVTESKVVDFNQLLNFSDYTETRNGVTFDFSNGMVTYNGLCTGSTNVYHGFVNVVANHKYLLTNYPLNMPIQTNNSNAQVQVYGDGVFVLEIPENSSNNYRIGISSNSGRCDIRFRIQNGNSYDFSYYPQLFDLTVMGLEDVTIDEFKSYFPNDYYPYIQSQQYLIENYKTVTYNDSDVGSQMFYTLYNTVDKYFNMDNIFGMHDIYSWFELNIFGGTAPLSIYVVWNIVLYEFVMDLLMLLYALFMFFIDCCKALLEKPLNSVK